MSVAVITMVFNEAVMLPLWIKHYSSSLPRSNLYILDHGSTDGSTEKLSGVNIISLPRDKFDDYQRAEAVTHLQHALLKFYDTVIYTDCDEFIVPDPKRYKSLSEYASLQKADVIAGMGLNVFHRPNREPPIDFSQPVLKQRRFAYLRSGQCKPALVKTPTKWSAGFHYADKIPTFDAEVAIFHFRSIDLASSLERLRLTRELAWPEEVLKKNMGNHQRLDDETYALWFHLNREAEVDRGEIEEFNFVTQIEDLKRSLHSRSDFCVFDSNIKYKPVVIPDRFCVI